jgi:recombination protein RecA
MPNKKEPNELDTVIAEINKQTGENTIGFFPKMENSKLIRIPSGSLWLDFSMGGGFPMGRIVEIFGNFSSGKSLICLKTIAEAQKLGKKCFYIDAENSFDPEFAVKNGVNLKNLLITKSSVGEKTFDILISVVEAGIDVVVVDSVASIVPMPEYKDTMEQQTIGLHARLMSKMLRKLNAVNKNSLIIFINQLRENVGAFNPYGVSFSTTGGRALGFYSSVRVEVKKGEDILDKKRRIGQLIKFKVQKNKTAAPFKVGQVKFIYDDINNLCYFDSFDEIVSLSLLLGVVKQAGPYYSYNNKKFLGRNALEKELKENEELFNQLKNEVIYDKKTKKKD